MFCKKCGAKIDDDSKFCTECGHVVGEPIKDENIENNLEEPEELYNNPVPNDEQIENLENIEEVESDTLDLENAEENFNNPVLEDEKIEFNNEDTGEVKFGNDYTSEIIEDTIIVGSADDISYGNGYAIDENTTFGNGYEGSSVDSQSSYKYEDETTPSFSGDTYTFGSASDETFGEDTSYNYTSESETIYDSDDKPSYINNSKNPNIIPSKNLGRNIAIAVGVVALLVIAYFFMNKRSYTVNLSDYYNINVVGANGYGRAEGEFDYDRFIEDYEDKLKFSKDKSGRNSSYSPAEYLADYIAQNQELELTPNEKLRNGDSVTLNVSLDEEPLSEVFKNLKIENKSISDKVDGLVDADAINPFDYIEVTFEDPSPHTNMKIKIKNDAPDYMRYASFTASQNSDLSLGDEVVVNLDEYDVEGMVNEYNVVLEPVSNTYTVSGVDKIVEQFSDLTLEEQEKLKSDALKYLNESLAFNAYSNLKEANLVGTYNVFSEEHQGYGNNNYIHLIYDVTSNEIIEDTSYNKDFKYFTVVSFWEVHSGGNDPLYEVIEIKDMDLVRLIDSDETSSRSIKYDGSISLPHLVESLNKSYPDRKIAIDFTPEDYIYRGEGPVGEYLSDKGNYLKLIEGGEALYYDGHEVSCGPWENNGDSVSFVLVEKTNRNPVIGSYSDGKIFTEPQPDSNWYTEEFTKQ